MPLNHAEIIEDLEAHIRKTGGAAGEWWVGTAKDSRSPFFQKHLVADLSDGLVYREAIERRGWGLGIADCRLSIDDWHTRKPGRGAGDC